MWEREAVTAATARLLRRVRAEGQGAALFVIGEAGLSKTAVLEQAVRLAGTDFKIGFARGDPMESMLAFGLLSQSMDGKGRPRSARAGAGWGVRHGPEGRPVLRSAALA